MIRGLLLDLDNTLYAYDPVHTVANAAANRLLAQALGTDEAVLAEAYKTGRHWVHHQLHGTASSHNRLLYYQRALEHLGHAPYPLALQAYRTYWGTFCAHMQYREGAQAFLQQCIHSGIRICLLTDLTADVQYQKIAALGLGPYLHHLVTSEEAGVEKPEAAMFQLGLDKLGLPATEVAMIGDNYEKDIEGALALDIRACWLPLEDNRTPDPRVHTWKTFDQLWKLL